MYMDDAVSSSCRNCEEIVSYLSENIVPKMLSVYIGIQWNLRIMDTLGPGILSFIERLSSLRRLKMY